MATLRHPSIVMYLGVCLDPPCMVTEYCARGSLNDVLKRARASPSLAQQLDWPRRLNMVSGSGGQPAAAAAGCRGWPPRAARRSAAQQGGEPGWGWVALLGGPAAAPWSAGATRSLAASLRRLWMLPRACCTCTRARRPSFTGT
jgi:hypothetical protein